MPLNTQIERNGELLTLNWGWWHVQCMFEASALDDGLTTAEQMDEWEHERLANNSPLPVYNWNDTTLGKTCEHIVKNEYCFVDPADNEELVLLPGDILRAHR